MSTDWDDFDLEHNENEPLLQVIEAPGFPPPRHPSEADLFARHEGVPGHDQEKLSNARIVMVGAGGLGSWVGLALVRSGVRHLTIIDPDRFDRTNAPRQLMFRGDIWRLKVVAVAQNLAPHMVAAGVITAMTMPLEQALGAYPIPADVLVVLVDNNGCRLKASQFARRLGIPAVFSMLSLDGVRMQTFLQGVEPDAACLWCALPNLDPNAATPCASGIVTSCLLAAAHATFFVHRALMAKQGMPDVFNWRIGDLLGGEEDVTSTVRRRRGCLLCAGE